MPTLQQCIWHHTFTPKQKNGWRAAATGRKNLLHQEVSIQANCTGFTVLQLVNLSKEDH